MKVGVLGQVTEFLIQHPQALARNFVRIDVVDADLQRVETRFIQALDAFRREVITIRNQAGDNSP